MLNLTIKTTQTITTDDLEIFVGDAPLTFEAIGNISNSLHTDLLTWSRAGYPADQAAGFIPRLFVSVSQNGEKYDLTGQAAAVAFQEAVGDDLLKDIIEGYWDYRYRFFRKRQAGSVSLPPASENGTPPAS